MEIDYIFGAVLFISVVVWASVTYSGLFETHDFKGLESEAALAMDAVENEITGEAVRVPVIYDSSEQSNFSVFGLGFFEPGLENSARVKFNGSYVSCKFDSGNLYWRSPVAIGQNRFVVEYGNFSAGPFCTSSFSAANATAVNGLLAERERVVVQGMVDGLVNMDYGEFIVEHGINGEIRVVVNSSGSVDVFGKELPADRSVVALTRGYEEYVSGNATTVKVFAW